jgi:hypothetical protein
LVLPKVLWFCVFRSKLNSAWVLNPTMIVRKGWNEKRGQLSVLLSFGKKIQRGERGFCTSIFLTPKTKCSAQLQLHTATKLFRYKIKTKQFPDSAGLHRIFFLVPSENFQLKKKDFVSRFCEKWLQ